MRPNNYNYFTFTILYSPHHNNLENENEYFISDTICIKIR